MVLPAAKTHSATVSYENTAGEILLTEDLQTNKYESQG
jgi:hypothetical protein